MTARQRILLFFVFFASTACVGVVLHAQSPKEITLRMTDWRTGRLIATTDFLVQINHQQTEHADWVKLNDDGSGKLTLPPDATLIFIQGKYDSSLSLYVNCDSEKKTKVPTFNVPGDQHWYSVDDILKSGIVAHNGCGRGKDDPKFVPKAGEFVFFVRKESWREEEQN
jgi:hypothetical protein